MTEEKNTIPTNEVGSNPTGGIGLEPNISAMLAYLFGWVGGIIFYLLEKDNKFVRFAAMQSILFNVAIIAIYFVLGFLVALISMGGEMAGIIVSFLYPVLLVGGLVVWVMLMLKAYNNQEWELPIIGPFARTTIK